MALVVDKVSEDSFHTNLMMGLVKLLNKSPGVSKIRVVRKSSCSHGEICSWEQKHGVILPDDMRTFYLSTDGYSFSWSYLFAENEVRQVGRISINSLAQFTLQFGLNTTQVAEVYVENGRYALHLGVESKVFEITALEDNGKVFLVYLNKKYGPTIWLYDSTGHFYYLAKTFTRYFRMCVKHLGIPMWQNSVSPTGNVPSWVEQLFLVMAPHLLPIGRQIEDLNEDSGQCDETFLDCPVNKLDQNVFRIRCPRTIKKVTDAPKTTRSQSNSLGETPAFSMSKSAPTSAKIRVDKSTSTHDCRESPNLPNDPPRKVLKTCWEFHKQTPFEITEKMPYQQAKTLETDTGIVFQLTSPLLEILYESPRAPQKEVSSSGSPSKSLCPPLQKPIFRYISPKPSNTGESPHFPQITPSAPAHSQGKSPCRSTQNPISISASPQGQSPADSLHPVEKPLSNSASAHGKSLEDLARLSNKPIFHFVNKQEKSSEDPSRSQHKRSSHSADCQRRNLGDSLLYPRRPISPATCAAGRGVGDSIRYPQRQLASAKINRASSCGDSPPLPQKQTYQETSPKGTSVKDSSRGPQKKISQQKKLSEAKSTQVITSEISPRAQKKISKATSTQENGDEDSPRSASKKISPDASPLRESADYSPLRPEKQISEPTSTGEKSNRDTPRRAVQKLSPDHSPLRESADGSPRKTEKQISEPTSTGEKSNRDTPRRAVQKLSPDHSPLRESADGSPRKTEKQISEPTSTLAKSNKDSRRSTLLTIVNYAHSLVGDKNKDSPQTALKTIYKYASTIGDSDEDETRRAVKKISEPTSTKEKRNENATRRGLKKISEPTSTRKKANEYAARIAQKRISKARSTEKESPRSTLLTILKYVSDLGYRNKDSPRLALKTIYKYASTIVNSNEDETGRAIENITEPTTTGGESNEDETRRAMKNISEPTTTGGKTIEGVARRAMKKISEPTSTRKKGIEYAARIAMKKISKATSTRVKNNEDATRSAVKKISEPTSTRGESNEGSPRSAFTKNSSAAASTPGKGPENSPRSQQENVSQSTSARGNSCKDSPRSPEMIRFRRLDKIRPHITWSPRPKVEDSSDDSPRFPLNIRRPPLDPSLRGRKLNEVERVLALLKYVFKPYNEACTEAERLRAEAKAARVAAEKPSSKSARTASAQKKVTEKNTEKNTAETKKSRSAKPANKSAPKQDPAAGKSPHKSKQSKPLRFTEEEVFPRKLRKPSPQKNATSAKTVPPKPKKRGGYRVAEFPKLPPGTVSPRRNNFRYRPRPPYNAARDGDSFYKQPNLNNGQKSSIAKSRMSTPVPKVKQDAPFDPNDPALIKKLFTPPPGWEPPSRVPDAQYNPSCPIPRIPPFHIEPPKKRRDKTKKPKTPPPTPKAKPKSLRKSEYSGFSHWNKKEVPSKYVCQPSLYRTENPRRCDATEPFKRNLKTKPPVPLLRRPTACKPTPDPVKDPIIPRFIKPKVSPYEVSKNNPKKGPTACKPTPDPVKDPIIPRFIKPKVSPYEVSNHNPKKGQFRKKFPKISENTGVELKPIPESVFEAPKIPGEPRKIDIYLPKIELAENPPAKSSSSSSQSRSQSSA